MPVLQQVWTEVVICPGASHSCKKLQFSDVFVAGEGLSDQVCRLFFFLDTRKTILTTKILNVMKSMQSLLFFMRYFLKTRRSINRL